MSRKCLCCGRPFDGPGWRTVAPTRLEARTFADDEPITFEAIGRALHYCSERCARSRSVFFGAPSTEDADAE